jgi:hypothetical protein
MLPWRALYLFQAALRKKAFAGEYVSTRPANAPDPSY